MLIRLTAALLAGVALVVAIHQVPRSIRTARERFDSSSHLSRLQRELAPARFWGMNVPLLLRAGQTLPRDATYRIVASRRQAVDGVPFFYAYWLLPRRRSNGGPARWIVMDEGSRGEILQVHP